MRVFAAATLLFLTASSIANAAEPVVPAKPQGDPAVRLLLDELKYRYDVDEEGDYRLTFGMDEEKDGRSQLVFVRSPVETYGSHRVREIWSPAYLSATDEFPAKIATRLLEATQERSLCGIRGETRRGCERQRAGRRRGSRVAFRGRDGTGTQPRQGRVLMGALPMNMLYADLLSTGVFR